MDEKLVILLIVAGAIAWFGLPSMLTKYEYNGLNGVARRYYVCNYVGITGFRRFAPDPDKPCDVIKFFPVLGWDGYVPHLP